MKGRGVAKKVKEKNDGDKLKPFIYELKIEGIVDNREEWNDKRMLRVMGVILVSNFLKEGSRIAPPLIAKSIKKRIHIDDKIRVTMYSKNKDIGHSEEGNPTFSVSGHRYELWDSANDSWACVYENFEGDKQDT
jgi:hypothetical protein